MKYKLIASDSNNLNAYLVTIKHNIRGKSMDLVIVIFCGTVNEATSLAHDFIQELFKNLVPPGNIEASIQEMKIEFISEYGLLKT